MRRLILGLLLVALLALGTGSARFAHQASHDHSTGVWIDGGIDQLHEQEPSDHDEHHCSVCALFVLPILVFSITLTVMALGLVRDLRAALASFPVESFVLGACGCRGPPIL